jgi:hypothetical protein
VFDLPLTFPHLRLSLPRFESGGISVLVARGPDGFHVHIEAESPRPMLLHWGVNDWLAPDPAVRPPNTNQVRSGLGAVGAVEGSSSRSSSRSSTWAGSCGQR